MHLILKLKPDVSAADRNEALAYALEHGAATVEPLLPGHTDPDSTLLFVLKVGSARKARTLIAGLEQRPEVEYVEETPDREPRH